MRRGAPVVVLGLVLALLLGAYILFSRRVVVELRRDASRSAQMYAEVYRALNDPREEAGNEALLELSRHISELGVPLIVTDTSGTPTAYANLPFDASLSDPRVRAYVAKLDRENPPVITPGIQAVHYGDSELTTSLRFIPVFLTAVLAIIFVAGAYVLWVRNRAERERVWAGMARESAHQLATPLSSLSGWVELLRERSDDPVAASAVSHMDGDLDRLERVAHRFERIGRPPRRDPVDVGELAQRMARYFQARVPTLAYRVTITATCGDGPLLVEGDAVLLEWALEALTKNALDALAGRGGRITITADRVDEERVRVRVMDDGPGVPREIRSRIFEAGFSTKDSGWGIGLSLAKRIIEENHHGKLVLATSDRGAAFDVILRGCM
ncbi:MAG TPA: HAMP domain-containing sensor histidine kinase [Gemmatimonadaceae bacterium]|nr:HAMP domain-containing sensor histidine kinase [Gemmatimonadaceae bacterium]